MQPAPSQTLLSRLKGPAVFGWAVTAVLTLIPVGLWLSLNPMEYNFTTIYVTAGTIGKIAGLSGIVLYALNLIYATRLRIFEHMFGGLNRVYIAHHIVGGLALIALSIHPVMLAIKELRGSVRDAALLLLPNGLAPVSDLFARDSANHLIVLEQWAIFFGIVAFWGMVVLLVITFFVKLPYRLWLFTHKFLGAFFFLAGLHVFFISSDTQTGGLLRYYILSIAALGLLAFVYRTLLGKILIRKYWYRVQSVATINDVVSITMQPVGMPMSYKPGQFIFIRFTDGSGSGITDEWHPFSVASAPGADGVTIMVKALGDYTKSLLRVHQGMQAQIEGAYGAFTYTNFKNTQQIWIAGGIGITPFLSMAQSLPQRQEYSIDLYYSVKNESELLGIDALTALVNAPGSNLRIIPYDTSKYGFLNVDAIKKISGEITHKEFFICGPPAMMKSMRKQLRSQGVPNTAIHSEEFAMS